MIAALETPNGLMQFVMLPALFLALANMAMLMQRLRARHYDTWTLLGQPLIFQRYSSSLMKFITPKGSYRTLHDPRLNWHVRLHYALSAILLARFACVILLGLGRTS